MTNPTREQLIDKGVLRPANQVRPEPDAATPLRCEHHVGPPLDEAALELHQLRVEFPNVAMRYGTHQLALERGALQRRPRRASLSHR